jgi:hypothetical protein
MNRRAFLAGSSALTMMQSYSAKAAHTGKTVGAIRWDPWYEDPNGGELLALQSTLGPAEFQGRAPDCAVASSYYISFAACQSQARIDAEITAAKNAGLDYWAYCWYGASSQLQKAWVLHQSSSIKNQMNWCLLFNSSAQFVSLMTSAPATYAGYCTQSNYQKVLTSRPLVYILHDFSTPYTSIAPAVATFISACATAGAGTPYVVILAAAATGVLAATGCQATGNYAIAAGQAELAGSYASLVSRVEAYWGTMLATGQAVIPTAVTGYDRRPRIKRPVPWGAAGTSGQKPWIGAGIYYQSGTPSAIASHVADMLTWLTTNAANSPAQTGLIYSWDEHDEGGSTLNPTLGSGSAILNAVAGVL